MKKLKFTSITSISLAITIFLSPTTMAMKRFAKCTPELEESPVFLAPLPEKPILAPTQKKARISSPLCQETPPATSTPEPASAVPIKESICSAETLQASVNNFLWLIGSKTVNKMIDAMCNDICTQSHINIEDTRPMINTVNMMCLFAMENNPNRETFISVSANLNVLIKDLDIHYGFGNELSRNIQDTLPLVDEIYEYNKNSEAVCGYTAKPFFHALQLSIKNVKYLLNFVDFDDALFKLQILASNCISSEKCDYSQPFSAKNPGFLATTLNSLIDLLLIFGDKHLTSHHTLKIAYILEMLSFVGIPEEYITDSINRKIGTKMSRIKYLCDY